MDLVANTGQNDDNSVWGSGLLDTIGKLTNTGLEVYGAVSGKTAATPSTPTAAGAPSAPASSGSSWGSYLPWVLGGVVLLVVVLFVVRKS